MDCFQLSGVTLLIHIRNEEEVFARKLGEASLVSHVLESKLNALANKARSANQFQSWSEAIDAYDKFLEVVRKEGDCLSNELRVWLITWASVKVAPLRQLRVPSYEISIDVYDNLLGCLESLDGRHCSLAEDVKDLRRMVLLDWRHYLSVCPVDIDAAAQSVRFSLVFDRLREGLSQRDPKRIEITRMLTLQHAACGHYEKALYWAGQNSKLLEDFLRKCAELRRAGFPQDFTSLYDTFYLGKLVESRTLEADLLCRIGEYEQAKANLLDFKAKLEAMVDSNESLELSEDKINLAFRTVNNTLMFVYLSVPDDADVRSAIESLETECGGWSDSIPSAAENAEASSIAQLVDRGMQCCEACRFQEGIECLKVAFHKIKASKEQSTRRGYGYRSARLLADMYENLWTHDNDEQCLLSMYEYVKEAYYFASEMCDLREIADACYSLGRVLSALLKHQQNKGDMSAIAPQVAKWFKADGPPTSASSLLLQEELDWVSVWLSAVYFYKLSASMYSEVLYDIRDRNTSWMKVMNDFQHKFLYVSSQILMVLMVLTLDEDTHEDIVKELSKKGLLWAERGRSRTLVYQLGPGYLYNIKPTASMREFLDFDLQDEVAWDALTASQRACGDGTVFIEYHCTNSTFICYVVTKEGNVSVNQLPKQGKALEELLDTLLSSMSNENEYDESQVLGQLEVLYSLFVEPFAQFFTNMEKTDKLVFCPHETVARVPFAILRNPKTKRFLFEDHTVSLTPSLRILHSCQSRLLYLSSLSTDGVSGKLAVAVADPAYEKQPIEKTLVEVKALESLFRDQCASLTGKDATVEKFLQLVEKPSIGTPRSYYGVIHLAVHGHVNSSFKQGALQFAVPQPASVEGQQNFRVGGIQRDDSQALQGSFAEVGQVVRRGRGGTYAKKTYLRSEDITNCGFDWCACMVVLSACNTSQGEVLAEGVLNLPRALTTVGVPCTIMSQWECVDESTAELMVEFYRNMKKGDDAATALRRSMLVLLDKKRKEPILDIYRWGAFTLWGLPTVRLPAAMLHQS